MRIKAVSGIMLILLFIGMLTLVFNIQPVKAEPATIIVPDHYEKIQWAIGNASYGDTIFVRAGTYYENVVVNKNNLTLVGENRNTTTIEGSDAWDVVYVVSSFVQIENLTIKNNITSNQLGIRLSDGTWGNIIKNNIITTSSVGIYIHASSGNTISRNRIGNSSSSGIESHWSSNNKIEHNFITNVSYIGIGVWGNPGSNNEVVSNKISKCGIGIVIGNFAIYNTFRDNFIELTTYRGIDIWSSNYNSISGNNITSNFYGIILDRSSNNTIIENNIRNNFYGTHLIGSFSNGIGRNNISNNYRGIRITDSADNLIFGNNIISNYCGFYFASMGILAVNSIYHNNLINNTMQVYDESDERPGRTPMLSVWDDGYPSGGNYWSDYAGVDFYNGPYQNLTGSDGIGDTPYVIDGNNRDRYPLMKPWTLIEIGVKVKGKNYSVTIISNATINQIVATTNTLHFKSSGPTGETGYIKVIFPMVNTTDIKVFINGEKLTPPPFPVINTNGTHYFIYFEFTLSTYEITIQFGIVGDVNEDGKVDILDVKLVKLAYSEWIIEPNADIDNNGVINILDLKKVKLIHSGFMV